MLTGRAGSLIPARTYLQARWLASQVFENRRFRGRQLKRSVVTNDAYSYKPFDDTQSIFVHIPKCAGVSLARTLYGNLAGGHTTLDEYVSIFEPAAFLQYFKFAIVRNPWDRLVSAYCFLKAGGLTEADRKWAEAELHPYDDFDAFVRGWLNRKNIWKWFHFRPQYHYIVEKCQIVTMDFIGSFENLEEDFAYICGKLGKNARLPQHNDSAHLTYTEYYCEATRQIVADVYERDIAQLGYAFGSTAGSKRVATKNGAELAG